jgi:hypothetical protein
MHPLPQLRHATRFVLGIRPGRRRKNKKKENILMVNHGKGEELMVGRDIACWPTAKSLSRHCGDLSSLLRERPETLWQEPSGAPIEPKPTSSRRAFGLRAVDRRFWTYRNLAGQRATPPALSARLGCQSGVGPVRQDHPQSSIFHPRFIWHTAPLNHTSPKPEFLREELNSLFENNFST